MQEWVYIRLGLYETTWETFGEFFLSCDVAGDL